MHVKVGHTGLRVSRLCFGTMTFGDGADEATSGAMYRAARDRGIDFFDTANVYAGGESERILGRLVQGHRREVVIATKVFFPVGDAPNDRGLSRLHVLRSVEDSLRRLGTEHVDILYFHAFDAHTPLRESLGAAADLIRAGKVRYLGLSNFSAWQVVKANAIAREMGASAIACIQPMYNLLKRQCESEILPMAVSEGLGVFPYSPVAGGLLTGKYLTDGEDRGRLDTSEMYQQRYSAERQYRTVEDFVGLAGELGVHPVALALAWVASHPAVTAPIIGARTEEHLRTALGSLDVAMTPELRDRIAALSPAPPLAHDREEERA